MKQLFFLPAAALGAALAITSCGDNLSASLPDAPKTAVNFIVASDLGRNGYYEQKPIAQVMGRVAGELDVELVAAAGDVHHFGGVASVSDPLWMTNYELIYDHPDLMIDWYAICGNHEYRGSTQAVLDYSRVSRRWVAPAYYYSKVLTAKDGAACRLLFINTTPLIGKYRADTLTYPDAHRQDAEAQLRWIDSVLERSTEKWKIVIGHHPVYAQTKKDDTERADMQARLAPILEKHKVDAYLCGHIHNFQHIRPEGAAVSYVVNSAGSLARSVTPLPDTKFCSSDPGFTLCSASADAFRFYFINHRGETIYSYAISK
ncbi:MAG: metallophosphoesterase [Prevotellaceae bacterium]|jgi:predicted phosphohydrolase|nr:metallophosphoesterase [Prevotellaceae bacterium]